MKRILLYLKYDGTNYHGWQVQPNGITVQQMLCEAAEKVFGARTDITGCSRTDAGVHANMFCCHTDIESDISLNKIPAALNFHLPKDISVYDCREVAADFHARYSAKGKSYVYKILNSAVRDPFMEGYALRVARKLDVDILNRWIQPIVGTHDFSAFCASGCSTEDHVRTVTQCFFERKGDIVELHITADGFLYNMVRIIAGTALDMAAGRIDPEKLAEIIESKDRSRAGQTAAGYALYLNKVIY